MSGRFPVVATLASTTHSMLNPRICLPTLSASSLRSESIPISFRPVDARGVIRFVELHEKEVIRHTDLPLGRGLAGPAAHLNECRSRSQRKRYQAIEAMVVSF